MNIRDDYFEWIYQTLIGKGYRHLLEYLFNEEFFYVVDLDDNRLEDGKELKYRYAEYADIPDRVVRNKIGNEYCSVLEMMAALSIRMEESIMYDPDFGDRTSIWFWEMIKSLGLYGMTDKDYDQFYAQSAIARFLNRDYDRDGNGGLFTVKNTRTDMRDIDIWYQMCLYSDNILGL